MQHRQPGLELALPDLLIRLIADGVWPADSKGFTAQNRRSLVPPERVRLFAADEDLIFLQHPPFRTIAQHMAGSSGEFWPKFGALDEIVPEQALVIGDFGMGSDSPIILNYACSLSQPPVCRLRWGPGTHTEWGRIRGHVDLSADDR